MATTSAWRQGKTEFVKQYLGKNPRANAKAVIDAWKADGREGTVSATLVNKMRGALGLAGNLRATRKKPKRRPTGQLVLVAHKSGRKANSSLAARDATGSSEVNGDRIEAGAGKLELHEPAGSLVGTLEELESDIDRLLFKVMNIGGLALIEDRLRQAQPTSVWRVLSETTVEC